MILGGYYLNYFKIYDVYTKYFKKENNEKDVLVTEEITTDLLGVLQQTANQENVSALQ